MAVFRGGFPNRYLVFEDVKQHDEFDVGASMMHPKPRWAPFKYGFCLGFIRPESWFMVNRWILDEAVPGNFVVGTMGFSVNWVETVYGFDDPHAAFAFKLRWR
jgi:hypothetical protein